MIPLVKNKFCIITFIFLLILTQQSSIMAVSIDDEEKAGEEFLLDVKHQLGVIDDPYVNGFINDLGQFLVQSVEIRPFKFRFYVIKNDDLNAFAGPGGYIFVFTGLIRAMDEVDELAAVMCHEIGHVTNRDISKQVAQYSKLSIASLLGVLAGALIGGDASEAVMLGSMGAAQQKQLAYSRDAERQADQAGFKYAAESGFDPTAIKKALMKLQEGNWGANEVPAYLLTHPINAERVSNIDSLLSSPYIVEEKPETTRFRNEYPIFRTIVMAEYGQKDEMLNYFTAELSKSPGSPLANLGMGIALEANEEYSKSIEYLEKAAKGFTEPSPVLNYLGEAYQANNEPDKAVSILKQALSKNGNDKTNLVTLAQIYQKNEEYDKAIKIYEKLKLMTPVEDNIFYNLGYSYGKENKLGLAHYNFGLFYKRSKNIKEAHFHFQEAKKEAKNDPELLKKIDDSITEIDKEKDKMKSEEKPGFSRYR